MRTWTPSMVHATLPCESTVFEKSRSITRSAGAEPPGEPGFVRGYWQNTASQYNNPDRGSNKSIPSTCILPRAFLNRNQRQLLAPQSVRQHSATRRRHYRDPLGKLCYSRRNIAWLGEILTVRVGAVDRHRRTNPVVLYSLVGIDLFP